MNEINEVNHALQLRAAQRKENLSVLTMMDQCTTPAGLTRSAICKNMQRTEDTVMQTMLLAHQEVNTKDAIQSLSKQCFQHPPDLATLGDSFNQFDPMAPSRVTHLLKQMPSIAMQRFSGAYINGVFFDLTFCDTSTGEITMDTHFLHGMNPLNTKLRSMQGLIQLTDITAVGAPYLKYAKQLTSLIFAMFEQTITAVEGAFTSIAFLHPFFKTFVLQADRLLVLLESWKTMDVELTKTELALITRLPMGQFINRHTLIMVMFIEGTQGAVDLKNIDYQQTWTALASVEMHSFDPGQALKFVEAVYSSIEDEKRGTSQPIEFFDNRLTNLFSTLYYELTSRKNLSSFATTLQAFFIDKHSGVMRPPLEIMSAMRAHAKMFESHKERAEARLQSDTMLGKLSTAVVAVVGEGVKKPTQFLPACSRKEMADVSSMPLASGPEYPAFVHGRHQCPHRSNCPDIGRSKDSACIHAHTFEEHAARAPINRAHERSLRASLEKELREKMAINQQSRNNPKSRKPYATQKNQRRATNQTNRDSSVFKGKSKKNITWKNSDSINMVVVQEDNIFDAPSDAAPATSILHRAPKLEEYVLPNFEGLLVDTKSASAAKSVHAVFLETGASSGAPVDSKFAVQNAAYFASTLRPDITPRVTMSSAQLEFMPRDLNAMPDETVVSDDDVPDLVAISSDSGDENETGTPIFERIPFANLNNKGRDDEHFIASL